MYYIAFYKICVQVDSREVKELGKITVHVCETTSRSVHICASAYMYIYNTFSEALVVTYKYLTYVCNTEKL